MSNGKHRGRGSMDVIMRHRGHIGRVSMLALLMLGLTFSPLQADTTRGQVTLTMPERVDVDGAEVVLGQLAVIAGGDAALTRQLQGIVVGRAPLPGLFRAARPVKGTDDDCGLCRRRPRGRAA